jgi:hypothetical protein
MWDLPGRSEREKLYPDAGMWMCFVRSHFHLFVGRLTSSCLPCLNACWTLAITEGSLENVFCPSVVCTKERATKDSRADNADKGVTPALVESVVGKTLRERWERIKENRIIETGEWSSLLFGRC